MSGHAYRLSFLLPPSLAFAVRPGRHSPCLHGCVLTIERGGLVRVDASSRGQVFDQVRRFLRIIAKGHSPVSIAAVLSTPMGRDHWEIIIGSAITFARTSLEPDLGPQPRERGWEPLDEAG